MTPYSPVHGGAGGAAGGGGGKGGGGDDGGVGGGEGETQAGLAHTRRQLLCVEEPTPGLK